MYIEDWILTQSEEEQHEYNNAKTRYLQFCKMPGEISKLNELRAIADREILGYYIEKYRISKLDELYERERQDWSGVK